MQPESKSAKQALRLSHPMSCVTSCVNIFGDNMANLKRIETADAPAAIGPYSQAIIVNGMIYTAGQIPLDPKSMEIIPGGIEEQTQQVMKNLAAILSQAGTSLQNVVKTTVFLQDMGEFAAMN